MKKVILASAVAFGVLATSALAYQGDCPRGERGMMQNPQGMQMQGARGDCAKGFKQGFHKGMRHGGGMMGKGGFMFSQLDLSDDQRYQLSLLRDEMRLEMKKAMGPKGQRPMQQFITDDGFDADGFKAYMETRHTKMSALKAEHMKKFLHCLQKNKLLN